MIAVIALYGLLIQGFLAGFVPGPSVAAADHTICLPDGSTTAPDGGSPVAHHGAACCTLACAPALPTLRTSSWSLSDGPRREAAPVVWTVAGTLVPTGPPVHAASARGPPLA